MNRILLVDDETYVVHALMRVMRMRLPKSTVIEGFDDPTRALARMKSASFDVVVSDFRMPQMDGIAFLKLAREVQPHAIRMILSASTEVENVMKAVNDVEVFRYLSKPWQEDELITHVLLALVRAEAEQKERALADGMRLHRGDLTLQEAERRRLEALEPGITHVDWGPHGEVLMPELDDSRQDTDITERTYPSLLAPRRQKQ